MHRLACFRDDIIFFIYLYQWWIYPVDHKRSNEYGQGGDEDDQTVSLLPEITSSIGTNSNVLGVEGTKDSIENNHLKID